jgi:hypothetical protein
MGCSSWRCCVHGRRVFVAWMDTRQHCREDGNPARRNRGRSGAGSDLRREIPAANRFSSKARRVQQGPILGPAYTHRERRLGYIPWNRKTEFGSCECLRRKARQLDLETRPPDRLRRRLMTGATAASLRRKKQHAEQHGRPVSQPPSYQETILAAFPKTGQ